MKCPECATKRKVSDGMLCTCGYHFALDPQKEPKLSDRAFKKAVDQLSGAGRYYFTFNQLYVALHKTVESKVAKERIKGAVFLGVFSAIVLLLLWNWVNMWVALVWNSAAVVGIVYFLKRSVTVDHAALSQAIRQYQSLHPIANLVDGTRFSGERSKDQLKDELFDYAPERILIVQNNDMVDMLVLNRFHFDNKTVVVAAAKYPKQVFAAVQRFLEKHPDLPVEIVHDVSREGLRLKEKLLSDPSWNLEGKNVKDLGLFTEDVDGMKRPIWIPAGTPRQVAAAVEPKSPAEAKVNEGMTMPVDFQSPQVLLPVLGVAALGGLLLMSNALLAEQSRRAVSDTGSDVGADFG